MNQASCRLKLFRLGKSFLAQFDLLAKKSGLPWDGLVVCEPASGTSAAVVSSRVRGTQSPAPQIRAGSIPTSGQQRIRNQNPWRLSGIGAGFRLSHGSFTDF